MSYARHQPELARSSKVVRIVRNPITPQQGSGLLYCAVMHGVRRGGETLFGAAVRPARWAVVQSDFVVVGEQVRIAAAKDEVLKSHALNDPDHGFPEVGERARRQNPLEPPGAV